MGDRGRIPAAEMSVAADNVESLAKRPEAPDHLTAEQKEIWRETVDALPADWFRKETLEVLAQYCRHVIRGRKLGKQIDDVDKGVTPFDVREYALLLRCQKSETEAINSTATKLRITLQSTYDKSKKKPPGKSRPWESQR